MADVVLANKQFEIDGYVFGLGCEVFIDEKGFNPGDTESLTQDGTNPVTGARIFGRDMEGSPSWQWNLHTSAATEAEALEMVGDMAEVWKASKWRVNGTVARLRYSLAGRTRCVFGRPRRFSFGAPDNRIDQGYLAPMASFDLVDSKTYDDQEQLVELRLVPSTAGGFTVPFTIPLVVELQTDTPKVGAMVVGGRADTAPVIEFIGPVTDPKLTIGPLTVALSGTVNSDETVTVDPRPWSMGVTGLRTGLTLARGTRLTSALVSPGAYQAVYQGYDLTGLSRCRVRWRNAYSTL